MKYFKVLNGNRAMHGGSAEYFLPVKNEDGTWTPGEWMPDVEGDLELCENGYHLVPEHSLIEWLGPDIYEAEYQGEMVAGNDKITCRSVRLLNRVEAWNEREARLFTCWCVRQVWHLLVDEHSKEAVRVAERYAEGDASKEELAAAWVAAWVAAWAAQNKELLKRLGL